MTLFYSLFYVLQTYVFSMVIFHLKTNPSYPTKDQLQEYYLHLTFIHRIHKLRYKSPLISCDCFMVRDICFLDLNHSTQGSTLKCGTLFCGSKTMYFPHFRVLLYGAQNKLSARRSYAKPKPIMVKFHPFGTWDNGNKRTLNLFGGFTGVESGF